MRRFFAATALAVSAVALVVGVAAATPNGADTLVTIGSPPTPFSQNKQNEPAVAVNPNVPSIAAAGANEEIDMEACNNRDDKTCPFTPGVCAGRQLRSTRRPNRDAAALPRGRPRLRRRSRRRFRPPTRSERTVLVVERLAALLRQPDLELQRRALGVRVQGLRGDRRLAPR